MVTRPTTEPAVPRSSDRPVRLAEDARNLTDAVYRNARLRPAGTAYRRRDDPDGWSDVTAAMFAAEVTAVARGLLAADVGPGDRVAVLSRTRYEWTLLDYAILAVGGVTVPIYETSSAEQVAWILGDSGAVAVVVESDVHRGLVESVRDRLPDLRHLWQLDGDGISLLTVAGAGVDDERVHERRRGTGPGDLATLIYTSGTTGRPKGCELTHGNLTHLAEAATTLFPEILHEDGSVLLFLPLAHVFGRVIQFGATHCRGVVGHTPDLTDLPAQLRSFRPSFLLAVPRVFEKVYDGARRSAVAAGRGGVFDAAAATAIAWSTAQDHGGPGPFLRLRHAVFDRLVYRRLRDAVGGRVLAAVSGSAPLGSRLGHFFRGVGIPVYEGYGLTETAACATVNTRRSTRVGSVGRAVPGSAVRIGGDGEILLRGPQVFRGYWRNPEATAEAFDDGWFRTGDVGELDVDGHLSITGRKKELIVTAGGKNVAPAVLEDGLRAHPLVSQCMVVGDRRPFVAALVTVDAEALPDWLALHGRPAGTTAADLVDDAELRAEVAAGVRAANAAVSRAEAIREFRILPTDLTEEAGELTPTMKVKRAVVAARYGDVIDALYGPEASLHTADSRSRTDRLGDARR